MVCYQYCIDGDSHNNFRFTIVKNSRVTILSIRNKISDTNITKSDFFVMEG